MIYPVILAGGCGTRLWPVSRQSFPKQFSTFFGEKSLFQQTLDRLSGPSFAPAIVVTHDDYRFIVDDQALEEDQPDITVITEPVARNTAPAALVAALSMQDTPDAVMMLLPSDHMIEDKDAFEAAVLKAEKVARKEGIVLFGVPPTRVEPGFGHLHIPQASVDEDGLQEIAGFVEKPDRKTAEKMVNSSEYLWNAGIVLCRVGTLVDAFLEHAPHLVSACESALQWAEEDLTALKLHGEAYAQCEAIALDYAVLEHQRNMHAAVLDCGWSDMGSWSALQNVSPKDSDGNTLSGNATAIRCENSLLKSENPDIALVGLGLEDIVAVATDDGILVAHADAVDEASMTVDVLCQQDAIQAKAFRRNYRPWGYYETLSLGHRFQVKRIMVKPGGRLSLQSHVHRAEHWVVVAGSAQVTVGNEVKLLTEDQSTYIPLGEIHRLENPGKLPLHLIEVQSGSYLGEDDIARYEDVYNRATVVA